MIGSIEQEGKYSSQSPEKSLIDELSAEALDSLSSTLVRENIERAKALRNKVREIASSSSIPSQRTAALGEYSPRIQEWLQTIGLGAETMVVTHVHSGVVTQGITLSWDSQLSSVNRVTLSLSTNFKAEAYGKNERTPAYNPFARPDGVSQEEYEEGAKVVRHFQDKGDFSRQAFVKDLLSQFSES